MELCIKAISNKKFASFLCWDSFFWLLPWILQDMFMFHLENFGTDLLTTFFTQMQFIHLTWHWIAWMLIFNKYILNRYLSHFKHGWSQPHHLPDLVSYQYFLCSYMENECYANNSHTIEELENSVADAVWRITVKTLLVDLCSFEVYLQIFVQEEGWDI